VSRIEASAILPDVERMLTALVLVQNEVLQKTGSAVRIVKEDIAVPLIGRRRHAHAFIRRMEASV
jgi:hypothetical protein